MRCSQDGHRSSFRYGSWRPDAFQFGIVGMYLSKVFFETKQRPYTIIRQPMSNRADPTMERFQAMRETAARYYGEKLRQFGAVPRGVDWKSEESQRLRFVQLLRLIDEREMASVNDYGCGYGALSDYLRARGFRGRYVGFDVAKPMIAAAATQPRRECVVHVYEQS